jgi:hypothetical protein
VGIFTSILETLHNAADKHPDLIRLGVYEFNIESSVSASLSEIAVVALVMRPAFEPTSPWLNSKLDPKRLDAMAESIASEVTNGLSSEHQVVDERSGNPAGDRDERWTQVTDGSAVVARVRPLGYSSESTLYAGKHFREVRFGLRRGDPDSARTCGWLLRKFASVLKGQLCPIAYIHYPHRWNSYGDSSLDWLRVAYASDLDAGKDTTIEIQAWKLASRQDVALVAYEPSLQDRYLAERFARLHNVEPRSDIEPPEGSTSSDDRVGLCAEGEARVGLVADLLSEAGDVEVDGCTVAVLHGRTVANLILTRSSADSLEPVLRENLQKLGGQVERFEVSPGRQVIPRQGAQNSFTFWVAWVCLDHPRAIIDVLHGLRDQFHALNLPMPNIVYGATRSLADGHTCVAKVKFSCHIDHADAFGLLGGQGGLDTNSVSTSPGAARLRETIVPALHTSEDWHPPSPEWRTHPVRVAGSEPHEEPWGSLGLPASALIS